jgi:hypothetical protein
MAEAAVVTTAARTRSSSLPTVSTVRPPSPEFDLICQVVRPNPNWLCVRALLQDPLNFPEIQRLAQQHGVRPQLIAAYESLGWVGVPAEVRAECAIFQRIHVVRMLSLSQELRRIDALFAANDMPFVAFKGAALSGFLYGDLSQREYGDLDILVPKEHVAASERLLGALGYTGPFADTEFRHVFLAFQQQYAFVREDIHMSVDLHWHFNGIHSPFPLQPEEAWSELASVTIGERRIATPSGANLALLLAGHGTKEVWKKLGWVRDFATLVDRFADLDWQSIHRRAQRQGCGNAVLLGCTLAETLLAVPVPEAIAQAARGSRRVQSRSASIVRTMRGNVPPPSIRPYLEDLALCDRWSDRLKSISQQIFIRTGSDYAAWPLPPFLWGIYYLTRPFRLLGKGVRRFLKLGRVY